MQTINISPDAKNKPKRVHHVAPLTCGNLELTPHPATAGRYTVTSDGDMLGWIEAKHIGTTGLLSVAKIEAALDALLAPKTIKF
jgi:hypothetical protein